MSKKKKKKIKIKKKNFAIFIIIIILIIFSTTKIIQFTSKLLSTKTPKETEEKKKEKKETENLDEFDKIGKTIDYYNSKYKTRYIAYQKNNPNLTIIEIIKHVNMNLDKTKYKDIIEAKFLNTEKVLVNKYYYLTDSYIPENLENISKQYALDGMRLVHDAKEAFEKLASDAKKENLSIVAMSSYRSYDYQVDLYNKYVKSDGQEAADTYSGRPGHSEHQTGLAVDVYNQKETYTNFENTKEFIWMQKHAHEYGFILRFPQDKEEETGYHYESWHYRYVGIEAAKYIKENNISFEEYYATKIRDW